MNWQIGPFRKLHDQNPIMRPDPTKTWACPINGPVAWEQKDVFNPGAVVKDGEIQMLYRAEDVVGSMLGTSRVGLATSADGIEFEKLSEPILYPDNDDYLDLEWDGGCEDPRVVEDEDGRYYVYYSAWNGKMCRLCVASSTDLIHWKKHGPAFTGKHRDIWSKSGSVVTQIINGRLKAIKINGRYWMYWGETNIFCATSQDLMNWEVLEANYGEEKHVEFDGSGYPTFFTGGITAARPVLHPRPGRFDSRLVEPGPPALLTEDGIVLIYNSANADDPAYPVFSYSPGQALFDPVDPASCIGRCSEPFLTANQPYEIEGQTNAVVFVEGLVWFKDRWHLYYGTADSLIGTAVSD